MRVEDLHFSPTFLPNSAQRRRICPSFPTRNENSQRVPPGRTVSYRVAATSGTRIHPSITPDVCVSSRFKFGGAMSWTEALEVPRLADGRAGIKVSVQIVNPRRCGRWRACAAIDLTSNQFEIP